MRKKLLQAGGAAGTDQLDQLGRGRQQAGGHGDHQREEGHQKSHHDAWQLSGSKDNDQNRSQGHLGDGLGQDQQRVDGLLEKSASR